MLTPYGRATVRSVLGLCIEGGLRFKVIFHCLASPLMLYEAWKDIYATDGETAICYLVLIKRLKKIQVAGGDMKTLPRKETKAKKQLLQIKISYGSLWKRNYSRISTTSYSLEEFHELWDTMYLSSRNLQSCRPQ